MTIRLSSAGRKRAVGTEPSVTPASIPATGMQHLSSHTAVEHCEMCVGQTNIPSGFYLKELTENVNERKAGNYTVSNVAESNLICSHDSLKK